MRTESDALGQKEINDSALYGIHALRASENFPDHTPFHKEWYQAIGLTKLACYQSIASFKQAANKEYSTQLKKLNLPSADQTEALMTAATAVSKGKGFEHFIVPATQGGAGTSINMNANEIITNLGLIALNQQVGNYDELHPIEHANLFQSTNDIVPTALKLASMQLLNKLEENINTLRHHMEEKEKLYRNVPRMAYTQLQQAVPSSYGLLFGAFNDALSRDWWRVSKCFERIKTVNLGGGAIGTGIAIPRFYIMEIVPTLKRLSGLPITQSENLSETTSNNDALVEVHAILKANAVNLEKIASDIRLLAADISIEKLAIPPQQAGSSIMPGKVNPVICEFVISAAHKIYSNDQLISSLAGQGNLELNAYVPSIGHALLDSIKLLIAMTESLGEKLIKDLIVEENEAEKAFYESAAICTALVPYVGYEHAGELAKTMKQERLNIFNANKKLKLIPDQQLEEVLKLGNLLQKGFSLKDI